MTYEVYRYIFIGAAILCGVMLVVAVLLFILLKIPKVIGDLTGSTARKAIQNIREQNEKSGDKAYKVSTYNRERGKVTDKISSSGTLHQNNQGQMGGLQTTKIDTESLPNETYSNETTVLGNETTVLSDETSVLSPETTVLGQQTNETTVLSPGAGGETTVLSESSYDGLSLDPVFEIEYDITYIHTNEAIA